MRGDAPTIFLSHNALVPVIINVSDNLNQLLFCTFITSMLLLFLDVFYVKRILLSSIGKLLFFVKCDFIFAYGQSDPYVNLEKSSTVVPEYKRRLGARVRQTCCVTHHLQVSLSFSTIPARADRHYAQNSKLLLASVGSQVSLSIFKM